MKKFIIILLALLCIFPFTSCEKNFPITMSSNNYIKAPIIEHTEKEKEIIDIAYKKICDEYPEFKKISRDLLREDIRYIDGASGNLRISNFVFYYGGISSGHTWQYDENLTTGECKVLYNDGLYHIPDEMIGKKVSEKTMNGYKQEILSQIKTKAAKFGVKEDTDENYIGHMYFLTQDDKLTLSCEYIGYYDLPEDCPDRGCGIDHEHIFASVVIE